MEQPRRQLHSVALGSFCFRLLARDAGHLLQHGADRSGVVHGVAGRHRGVVERAAGGKQRRRAAERLRECADHSARADLVILGETSATVYPAAGFAIEVKERGGRLIEVNLYESEITQLCDLSLRGGSADVLPRLTRTLSELRRPRLS